MKEYKVTNIGSYHYDQIGTIVERSISEDKTRLCMKNGTKLWFKNSEIKEMKTSKKVEIPFIINDRVATLIDGVEVIGKIIYIGQNGYAKVEVDPRSEYFPNRVVVRYPDSMWIVKKSETTTYRLAYKIDNRCANQLFETFDEMKKFIIEHPSIADMTYQEIVTIKKAPKPIKVKVELVF